MKRISIVIVTLLTALVTVFGAQVPSVAAADKPTLSLNVDLAGKFVDADINRAYSRQTVVGTVAPSWKSAASVYSPRYGFSFTAPCVVGKNSTACSSLTTSGLRWAWDFGDGRTLITATNTPDAPIVYDTPGKYTVNVRVYSEAANTETNYVGSSSLTVLVSPRYADVDAATTGDNVEGMLYEDRGTSTTGYIFNQGSLSDVSVVAEPSATDGTVLQYQDNTAPYATFWASSASKIEYNPDVLYRVKVRVRVKTAPTASNAAGTPVVYFGFNGYNSSGALLNRVGSASWSDQSFSAASGAGLTSANGWVTYTGYVKGYGATAGSSGTSTNPSSPGVMHPGVKSVAPVMIMNFNGAAGNGAYQIDTMSVEAVESTSTGIVAPKSSPVDSNAIWAAGAYGLMPDCGVYLPAVGTIDNAGANDSGRSLFCANSPAFGTAPAPVDPANLYFQNNATTGVNCLASPSACGLPNDAFLNASGNEITACTTTECRNRLVSLGLVDNTYRTLYNPSRCEDNYTTKRGSATLVEGVEPGCLTYGDFMATLANAADGGKANVKGQLADQCAANNTTDATRRGVWLLGQTTAAGNLSSMLDTCKANQSISKAEAYLFLSALTGLYDGSSSATSGLRDLSGTGGLNTSTLNLAQQRGAVGGLISAGVPLVGTITCADTVTRQEAGSDPGACFNGGEAMQRRYLPSMISNLLIGEEVNVSGLSVNVDPTTLDAALGTPRQVNVTVYAPSWYPDDAVITYRWDDSDYANISCPSSAVSIGAGKTGKFTCTVVPTRDPGSGGAPLILRVNDDQGAQTATASTLLRVANDAPILGTPVFVTNRDEGTQIRGTLTVRDPQSNPVYFGVRSCEPTGIGGAREGSACVSTTSTFPYNADKTRTLTSDTDRSGLVESANTDRGTVSLQNATRTSVDFVLSPHNANNNGDVDFVIQACDVGSACVSKHVRFTIEAVNDAPQALSGITATTEGQPIQVTLGGNDAADSNQPGYPNPSNPLSGFRICSMPVAGTTPGVGSNWIVQWVNSNGTKTNATTGTENASRTLEITPVNTVTGTYTLTYQVKDVGRATPVNNSAWSGSACNSTEPGSFGTITVSNTNYSNVNLGFTVTPTNVAALSEDVSVNINGGASGFSYTVDWGDGTSTGPVSSTTLKHRYSPTSASTTQTYPVKVIWRAPNGNTGAAANTVNVNVQPNRLTNPTLETNSQNGWMNYNSTAAPGAITTSSRSGNYALSVRKQSTYCGVQVANSSVAALEGRVKRGSVYTAKVWLLGAYAGQSVNVALTENGTPGGNATTTSALSTTTWTQVNVNYTANTDNSKLNLTVIDTNTSRAANSTCFTLDDASLTGDAGAFNAYTAAVLDAGPWAYFKFDDVTSSATLVDSSGNNNNATVKTNAANLTRGVSPVIATGGSAGRFTNNDYVTVPNMGDAFNQAGTGPVTIEFWTTLPAGGAPAGTTAWTFSGSNLANQQVSLKAAANGSLGFSGASGARRAGTYTNGGPAHIVAELRRENGLTSAYRIYVNGNLLTLSGTAGSQTYDNLNTLVIGAYRNNTNADGGSEGWTAPIDDFAIYAKQLPAATIAYHYQVGSTVLASAATLDAPVLFTAANVAKQVDVSENGTSTFETVLSTDAIEKVTENETLYQAADGRKLTWKAGSKQLQLTTAGGTWTSTVINPSKEVDGAFITLSETAKETPVLYVNGSEVVMDKTSSNNSGYTENENNTINVNAAWAGKNNPVLVYDQALSAERAQAHAVAWIEGKNADKKEKNS